MRLLLFASACAAVVAAPASARPDGPLDAFLEYQASQVVLDVPATGTLTDGFGLRWGRLHAGIDIGILRSLEVRAAAAGSVTQVGWLRGYDGYGQVVIVDLGNGYETMYAHLSRIDVKVGQTVAAGARIGLVGSTGHSTGPHLHFEVRVRGAAVNPLPALR